MREEEVQVRGRGHVFDLAALVFSCSLSVSGCITRPPGMLQSCRQQHGCRVAQLSQHDIGKRGTDRSIHHAMIERK